MQSFNEEVVITLVGNWADNNPSIGTESLIVEHSENGQAPGVTFKNNGGGHFVQQFEFGANSKLPGGIAANIYANWQGLQLTGNSTVSIIAGPLNGTVQVEVTSTETIFSGNVVMGTPTPIVLRHPVGGQPPKAPTARLVVAGIPAGTAVFQADPTKGSYTSTIHEGDTGDWIIYSAAANGTVILQAQDPGAFVGIGTDTPTVKLDVEGSVKVSGDVILTGGADCAEDFDVVNIEGVEPGCVMVINDSGGLKKSDLAYDRRVAGVLSGAGEFKSALTLDRQPEKSNRKAVALMGKVYCKVDASYSAVEVGDLLTTSGTAGHAMKATDPLRSFGAVIGKALRPLREGQGLIPILVALQ